MELPAIIIYQLKPLGIYTESSIPYVWLGSELVSSHMVKCLKSFRGIRGVSEPIQTSQMEHSARIIYGLKPLTMFVESSIPEVRLSFWIGLFTYGLVTEGKKNVFKRNQYVTNISCKVGMGNLVSIFLYLFWRSKWRCSYAFLRLNRLFSLNEIRC